MSVQFTLVLGLCWPRAQSRQRARINADVLLDLDSERRPAGS
jgi:hypothetical protein